MRATSSSGWPRGRRVPSPPRAGPRAQMPAFDLLDRRAPTQSAARSRAARGRDELTVIECRALQRTSSARRGRRSVAVSPSRSTRRAAHEASSRRYLDARALSPTRRARPPKAPSSTRRLGPRAPGLRPYRPGGAGGGRGRASAGDAAWRPVVARCSTRPSRRALPRAPPRRDPAHRRTGASPPVVGPHQGREPTPRARARGTRRPRRGRRARSVARGRRPPAAHRARNAPRDARAPSELRQPPPARDGREPSREPRST